MRRKPGASGVMGEQSRISGALAVRVTRSVPFLCRDDAPERVLAFAPCRTPAAACPVDDDGARGAESLSDRSGYGDIALGEDVPKGKPRRCLLQGRVVARGRSRCRCGRGSTATASVSIPAVIRCLRQGWEETAMSTRTAVACPTGRLGLMRENNYRLYAIALAVLVVGLAFAAVSRGTLSPLIPGAR